MTLGQELLRFKPNQKYLIFDLETEGLNLGFSRPYQIAYITFTLDDILKVKEDAILWSDLKMSPGAAAVTKFDKKAYLKRARDAKEVLAEFEELLFNPEYIICGHNILGYDVMIHQVWRRQIGLPTDYSYLARCIDTNILCKVYKKGLKIDRSNLLAFQMRLDSLIEKGLKTKLSIMAEEFKINFDETQLHDALYDVTLNIEIFRKLVRILDI